MSSLTHVSIVLPSEEGYRLIVLWVGLCCAILPSNFLCPCFKSLAFAVVIVVVVELFSTLQTPFILLLHSSESLRFLAHQAAGAGGFPHLCFPSLEASSTTSEKTSRRLRVRLISPRVIRSMAAPLAAYGKHLAGGVYLAYTTTANTSHMGQDCEDLAIVQLLCPVRRDPLRDAKGAAEQGRGGQGPATTPGSVGGSEVMLDDGCSWSFFLFVGPVHSGAVSHLCLPYVFFTIYFNASIGGDT